MIENEISKIQIQFLSLFNNQKESLKNLSTGELRDLQHRGEELKNAADYSARVSGEVNFAAATLLLEERK